MSICDIYFSRNAITVILFAMQQVFPYLYQVTLLFICINLFTEWNFALQVNPVIHCGHIQQPLTRILDWVILFRFSVSPSVICSRMCRTLWVKDWISRWLVRMLVGGFYFSSCFYIWIYSWNVNFKKVLLCDLWNIFLFLESNAIERISLFVRKGLRVLYCII